MLSVGYLLFIIHTNPNRSFSLALALVQRTYSNAEDEEDMFWIDK
jgi:hypothetical protein